MKPNDIEREFKQNVAGESEHFGISENDVAHVTSILRDTLYSDKIAAVIREYSSNAWDAHRMIGKGDVPIKVTVPTQFEPTFKVRDYGPGLSRDEIFRVYSKYGASTKRSSDEAVGMLGIGSKSGFAYADSFIVISFNGGTKATYAAVIDPTNKGLITLLHEEPCGDETGIEIQIAVQKKDMKEFAAKCSQFFMYFDPRPTINVQIQESNKELLKLSNGKIYVDKKHSYYSYEANEWYALMGCIPYKIDRSMINQLGKLPSCVNRVSGVLFFDIGDIDINASREGLKYTEKTKTAVFNKINALVKEYVETVIGDVEKKSTTQWGKRLLLSALGHIEIPLPKEYDGFCDNSIFVEKYNAPIKKINRRRESRYSSHKYDIPVNSSTKIVIHDSKKSLRGYDICSDNNALFFKSVDRELADAFETQMQNFIVERRIQGIPIVRTSTLEWTAPEGHISNAVKHKGKVLVFDSSAKDFYAPYSRYWLPTDHIPTKDDVYVEISGYIPNCVDVTFGTYFLEDKRMCEILGKQMPDIYAYRRSKKDDKKVREGIPYVEWRNSIVEEALKNENVRKLANDIAWSNLKHSYFYNERIDVKKLEAILGSDHKLVCYMRNVSTALSRGKLDNEKYRVIESCVLRALRSNLQPEVDQKELEKLYPLFTVRGNHLLNANENIDIWCDYIKLVDKSRENK